MKTNENVLRRKIWGVSVLFHVAIIVLAMTTYFTLINKDDILQDDSFKYIEINFSNTNKSSGLASTVKNNNKRIKNEVNTRNIEKKQIKVEALEDTESEIIKSSKKDNTKSTKIDNSNPDSKTEGEGDTGEKISGRELGNMEFEGSGEFGRKVIYFAPIKKIAEKNGSIAVNMGINREGSVVAAAYDKNNSTIDDIELVKKALKMATLYKFEPDYSAPLIQYGRYTFIFKLNF